MPIHPHPHQKVFKTVVSHHSHPLSELNSINGVVTFKSRLVIINRRPGINPTPPMTYQMTHYWYNNNSHECSMLRIQNDPCTQVTPHFDLAGQQDPRTQEPIYSSHGEDTCIFMVCSYTSCLDSSTSQDMARILLLHCLPPHMICYILPRMSHQHILVIVGNYYSH